MVSLNRRSTLELPHSQYVSDTARLYQIFLGAFQGDIAVVRKLIESSNIATAYYVRPLMRVSTAQGDTQLLRVCFENGFLGTGFLDEEHLLRSRISRNPSTAWLDVLLEFDFRQWHTNPQRLSERDTWHDLLLMGVDCTRWWIEHGGHATNARGLFAHNGWLSPPTIRVLLDHFGVDWFRESWALQLAVKKHDVEVVKMLVEAGADVNELPTESDRDVREYRAAPLWALFHAIFAKSEDMIRYLVEHGAKLERKDLYIPDPYNRLAEEYWFYRDLVVELGGVKEEMSS